jgi:membrane protein
MKIRPRDVLELLKRSGKEFFRDDCPRLAAALSYYTVFSLGPLIALLLLLAGVIWDAQEVENAIGFQIRDLMGPQASREVLAMVAHKDPTGGRGPMATAVGLGLLVFGATGAFLQLQAALNRAWDVEPDPAQGGIKNFITKRVFSFGLILGIVFLLIVSLAVTAAVSALAERFGGGLPETLMFVLEFVFAFAVVTFLFAAMFKILPDAKIEWRDVWVGAIGTTILFIVGKFLIGFYLGRSDPGSSFGAAGTLAVILIWIYYASHIVLFGAEFTQAWANKFGSGIRPEEGASLVVEQKKRVLGAYHRTGDQESGFRDQGVLGCR